MLYMEKNMHDFDEEYVPGVRKKHNPAKWISLGAAAAMAIGIAAACIAVSYTHLTLPTIPLV